MSQQRGARRREEKPWFSTAEHPQRASLNSAIAVPPRAVLHASDAKLGLICTTTIRSVPILWIRYVRPEDTKLSQGHTSRDHGARKKTQVSLPLKRLLVAVLGVKQIFCLQTQLPACHSLGSSRLGRDRGHVTASHLRIATFQGTDNMYVCFLG